MSLNRPTRWAIALVLTAVAVAVSYQWLDRPIAYFAHAHFHNEPLFAQLTLIPEFFAPLAVLAFIGLGLRALVEKPLTRLEAVTLLCALSLVVASAIKNQLKLVFGRTWPETWVRDNPPSFATAPTAFIRSTAEPALNPFRPGTLPWSWR